MATTHTSRPWEIQADEPALWYDRFHTYMMLGPKRNLDATYRIVMGRNSRAPSHWWKKATEWNWRDRAVALDQLGWQELHQEQEQYARERRARRLRLIKELQDTSFVAIGNAKIHTADQDTARDLLSIFRNLFGDAIRQERIELNPAGQEAQQDAEPAVDAQTEEMMRRIWKEDE